jgi:hypothetical protein
MFLESRPAGSSLSHGEAISAALAELIAMAAAVGIRRFVYTPILPTVPSIVAVVALLLAAILGGTWIVPRAQLKPWRNS